MPALLRLPPLAAAPPSQLGVVLLVVGLVSAGVVANNLGIGVVADLPNRLV